MEIKEEVKKCKQCKISLKKRGTYCEKHIILHHVEYLIVTGTESQDKHPINKKFEAIEDFTKAIALGIEYLIKTTGGRKR